MRKGETKILFFQGACQPKTKDPKVELKPNSRALGYITAFKDAKEIAIEPLKEKKVKRLGV